MKISFLILFTTYLISYLNDSSSKLKAITISILVPLIYFLGAFFILSLKYGNYYAGQRLAESVIPILLSGVLLYINLNNKLKGKNRPPYLLISLVILFFLLAIIEISI